MVPLSIRHDDRSQSHHDPRLPDELDLVGICSCFEYLLRFLFADRNHSGYHEYPDWVECAYGVRVRVYSAWQASCSDDLQNLRLHYNVNIIVAFNAMIIADTSI